MINNREFSIRLKEILDHFELTASSFAEKIGVQRSSISHILSGRNKPSLDFILKVLASFPEVNLYWLLNGKGKFNEEVTALSSDYTSPTPLSNSEENSKQFETTIDSNSNIERIVIFFKDGSFKNFENS